MWTVIGYPLRVSLNDAGEALFFFLVFVDTHPCLCYTLEVEEITCLEDLPDEAHYQTISGLQFYFNDPCFIVDDIAHSLGMLCRYNGHCKRFYSVGNHSIMVSEIMEYLGEGDPLEGLLHDGTEAYLSDVPKPVKVILPEMGLIDGLLDRRLRQEMFLTPEMTPACHRADVIALHIEGLDLVADQGRGFDDSLGLRQLALDLKHRFGLQYRQPEDAKAEFLRRYEKLTAV